MDIFWFIWIIELIPIWVSLIILALIGICIFQGLRLHKVRKKMHWWRNEACKVNGNLRNIWNKNAEKAYLEQKKGRGHKTRAPWLRNR